MRTFLAIFRNGQGAYIAPSLMNASGYRMIVQPKFFAPFQSTLRLIIHGYQVISTCIASLLFFCRPSHVALFVMSVFVVGKPIQGMFGGRFTTYLCQKFWIRCKAKLNTTFAIFLITRATLIFASAFSGSISKIFRRLPISVSGCSLFGRLITITATRSRMLFHQISTVYGTPVSALAEAVPHGLTPFTATRESDDKQSSESLSGENFNVQTRFLRVGSDGKVVSSHFAKASPLVNLVRAVGSYNFFQPVLIIT